MVSVYLPKGTFTGHGLVYLRNMFTEGVGNLVMCSSSPTAVGCVPAAEDLAKQCLAVGAPALSLSSTSGIIMCPGVSSATMSASNVSVQM